MLKIIIFLLSLLLSTSVIAQQNKSEKDIKNVIHTFFEGLHSGDSTLVSPLLHKNIKIQTTATNREGTKVLKTESRDKLLTSIANKNPKTKYFEKLLSFEIKIDGNLASVWTPYEFYLNDNFSHCGANSFQLFDNNGKWEIIYLVDMRRRKNCNAPNTKK